ncbi:hypothetical protein [Oribacterium sp. WCC10]|uniref:hypothetical protein n=1 Tax=Oribacterium sp. WCC10 TaxID=1855343 RepID=UPI0008EC244F|nr:hypothetical protein [Oribacterium sp. WCC10]SFG15307.1 hypothetical protein SAMN05216356_102182 [Oribacterium sp. WCC10]
MIDIYIRIHPITFEDCGVLGGRTAFPAGTEMRSKTGKSGADFIEEVLHLLIRKSKRGKFIYPFKRIAVCFIDMDGAISLAYTGDGDIENNTYSYIDNKGNTGRIYSYYEIGELLSRRNIQLYAVFQQQDDGSFRAIGNVLDSSMRDNAEAGESSSVRGDRGIPARIFDAVRCLDLRGSCKAKVVEASDFHNYIKYELGEDFFIEAYDNLNTNSREYWLGRDYTKEKQLLNCFDLDDPFCDDYIGSDWKVHIDERFAEVLCKLTDSYEYLYIDNDYKLSMLALNLERVENGIR